MSPSTITQKSILAVTFLLMSSGQLAAEPTDLASLFPEKTLLYVALNGSGETAEARKATAYGKLVDDPQVQRLVTGVTKAIDSAIKANTSSDEERARIEAIRRVASAFWNHSTALAILDAGVNEGGPFAQVALVCKAGDEAEKIDQDLATVAQLPIGPKAEIHGKPFRQVMLPLPGGLYFGTVGDYFILAMGTKTIESLVDRIDGGDKSSLAGVAGLRDARKRIGGRAEGRVATLYLDVEAALKSARSIVKMMLGEGSAVSSSFDQYAAAMQVGRLKSVCYESYYHEGGILGGWVVQRAAAEDGTVSSTTKALTDKDLAIIPRSASWAWAANIDVTAIADAFSSNVKLVGGEFLDEAFVWIEKFEEDIGFQLNPGLLQLIGDTVIAYDAPEAGGLWFTGTTVLLESTNAEQLQTNIGKLVKGIAKKVGKKHLNMKSLEHKGHTVEFANVTGIPFPIAPAWARHEGWIVVGLYPQCVMAALDRLSIPSPRESSLLQRPDFIAARKVLGPLGNQISYVDSKAGFESLYPFVLLFAQVGFAEAQGEQLKIDISLLPSREAINRHLFGEVSISRSEGNCDVQLSYGALPVNPAAFVSISTASMAVSIMLPALSRARELSKRTVCSSNLRGIGQAMYIHANGDSDHFPDDVKTLIDELNATTKQFHCPSSGADADDIRACYEYIPGQSPLDDPTNVLMYEKEGAHQNEGANVLFVDAHVEFVKPYGKVKRLVQETKQRLKTKSKGKGSRASGDEGAGSNEKDGAESGDE